MAFSKFHVRCRILFMASLVFSLAGRMYKSARPSLSYPRTYNLQVSFSVSMILVISLGVVFPEQLLQISSTPNSFLHCNAALSLPIALVTSPCKNTKTFVRSIILDCWWNVYKYRISLLHIIKYSQQLSYLFGSQVTKRHVVVWQAGNLFLGQSLENQRDLLAFIFGPVIIRCCWIRSQCGSRQRHFLFLPPMLLLLLLLSTIGNRGVLAFV